MDVDALAEAGFVADEAAEAVLERSREGLREGGQQDAGVGVLAGEGDGAVEGDDGLTRAGGAGYAGWSVIVALDQLALRGVEEDGPFDPRVIEARSSSSTLRMRRKRRWASG